MDVTHRPSFICYFDLTPAEARGTPTKRFTKVFTPQDSICDKTPIHCDYLRQCHPVSHLW